MDELRQQDYSLSNNVPYITQAANYGFYFPLGTVTAFTGIPLGFTPSLMAILGWPNDTLAPQVKVGDAPLGATITGRWQGDPMGHVYAHNNDNQTDAYAVFTQGTWQINDTWALTLGVRYAEDEKEALEVRGGYAELFAGPLGGFLPVLNLLGGNPYIPIGADSTTEAQTNVAMGNANWNYNPATLAQMHSFGWCRSYSCCVCVSSFY